MSDASTPRSGWPAAEARHLVEIALREDVGEGDITTSATVPSGLGGRATLTTKAPGVLAGLECLRETFRQVDPRVRVDLVREDADPVDPDEVVARLEGPFGSLLTGERVALNFVAHLSGVATLTARFVERVAGTGAKVLDTRKTTPGLRRLEKYAVRCGGGENHRMGLFDAILVKENHIAAAGSVGEAVRRAREASPEGFAQVEVRSRAEAEEALAAGIRWLLLDNMSAGEVRGLVPELRAAAPDVVLEVSGGLSLANVAAFAHAGVDRLSVGALTHSAAALDLSLIVAPSSG